MGLLTPAGRRQGRSWAWSGLTYLGQGGLHVPHTAAQLPTAKGTAVPFHSSCGNRKRELYPGNKTTPAVEIDKGFSLQHAVVWGVVFRASRRTRGFRAPCEEPGALVE